MGSVRWTSFAHRLSQKHRVFVVTHDAEKKKGLDIREKDGITIIRIDNECAYVKSSNKRKANRDTGNNQSVGTSAVVSRERSNLKSVLKNLLYVGSIAHDSRANAKRIVRYLKSNRIELDSIATTSRPFIDAFLGYYIAKELKTRWVLDQRDLQYNDGASDFTVRLYAQIFRRMDKYVSAYTLVSHGMAETFASDCGFSEAQKRRIHVLTNGYDRTHQTNSPTVQVSGPLSFAYVGDLYTGRRDAGILFAAISKLLERTPEYAVTDFCIHYAGDEGVVLKQQADQFGLAEIVADEGRVKHERAIQIQSEADLMLLLTWNTERDQGILPGKFYEYMMAERPILCITCGSKPNGEAEGMVDRMNLGIAVNQRNGEQDIERLTDYLEQQLQRKKQGLPLLYTPDKEMVGMYDYDMLAQRLEQLISEIAQ